MADEDIDFQLIFAKYHPKIIGYLHRLVGETEAEDVAQEVFVKVNKGLDDFRGEKRTNKTHASTTDPESRLMKKSAGKEAKLSFGAHALMENRNGLLIDITVTPATGDAEREAAKEMLNRQARKRVKPKTIGADKGYDTHGFVETMRERTITPHVAANTERRGGSAIDGRTTRHIGYALSQKVRKRVEEVFGWLKVIGGFRRTRYKGRDRTHLQAWFVGAAYNLMRIANIQRRAAAAT
jgi:IS5 family transposase